MARGWRNPRCWPGCARHASGSLQGLETVVFRESGVIYVALRFVEGALEFFVVDVADAFEEEQGKDVLFVVTGVDDAAQEGGGSPEV